MTALYEAGRVSYLEHGDHPAELHAINDTWWTTDHTAAYLGIERVLPPRRCLSARLDRAPYVPQGSVNRGQSRPTRGSRIHIFARKFGWPGAGSNRRPSAFQADARTN